jgi:WD40 repeat protein
MTASVESYYADASRLVFKIRLEGQGRTYSLENISLTNSQNEELNTGYGLTSPFEDPSMITLEMIPAYALTGTRLDGQLSFSVMSAEAGDSSSRFHFDLDLPIHPAQLYLLNGGELVYNEAAYHNPIYVDRLVVTPAFTWAYLCYVKPTEADWMIGRDATMNIDGRVTEMDSYNLLYDSSMGDGTKGGEPGWTPIGNYPRCVKIGFPLGSEVAFPTHLTLTIPALEQSMPEVIPQADLDAAYPKLLAQGIDMAWHTEDHGAYPEWKKLPTGMTEQQAMRKFNEALGYVYAGPWIFNIPLMPQESSQPVFSTSNTGAPTPLSFPSEKTTIVAELSGRIRSFDISPDFKTIAFATSDGAVLYDLETYQPLRKLDEKGNVYLVAWSPDGKKLSAASLDDKGAYHLTAWDTSTWKTVFEEKSPDGSFEAIYTDIAWSPDSRFLASGQEMGVTVYDVQTGKVISQQEQLSAYSLSWSPDGSRLVSTGDWANGIRRWKVSTDESVRLFDQRTGGSMAIAWSPDGNRIASGQADGNVCFWTAATNQCDGLIHAHANAVFSLAWSSDGTRLATGGGIIRIWDTSNGQPVISVGEQGGIYYTQLEWPAKHPLVSLETGSESEAITIVRFWDVNTGKVLFEFHGADGVFGE